MHIIWVYKVWISYVLMKSNRRSKFPNQKFSLNIYKIASRKNIVSYRNSKNTGRDNKEIISARLLITGKVQGVYFRYNMQQIAKKNSVVGWVRNLPDGRVEASLSGNKIDVNNVVEWSKIGPENSRVDEVNIEYGENDGKFSDFVIEHDKT